MRGKSLRPLVGGGVNLDSLEGWRNGGEGLAEDCPIDHHIQVGSSLTGVVVYLVSVCVSSILPLFPIFTVVIFIRI